jgi:23S rRNA pseudouridine1911/1915/1917 synthase
MLSGPMLFPVLHEDDQLLVLHKPAGLVCHPTKGDAYSSLISRVRIHLGAEQEPQMVHRLDRETSGVMVFGKTAEAAAELRRLWIAGLVTKEYLALVHGAVTQPSGLIDGPLGRDESSRVAIKDCVRPDGASATTRWWRVRNFERNGVGYSLLRVRLDTGRKHQIRIHLATLGHPLVGDKLYGASEELYLKFVERRMEPADREQLMLASQALHAARLWMPWEGEEREFVSSPEPQFLDFLEGRPVEWLEDPHDPQRPWVGEAAVEGLKS